MTRLFVRTLDQLQAVALAGTEGAFNPFFSPNVQWIAFFTAASLRKVSVTGGAAVNICDKGDWRKAANAHTIRTRSEPRAAGSSWSARPSPRRIPHFSA